MSAEPKDGILGRVAKHFFTGVRSSGASNTGRAARTHTTPTTSTDVFSTTLFLRLPRLVFYRCSLCGPPPAYYLHPSFLPANSLTAHLPPLTLLHLLPSASEDTHVL